MNTVTTPATTLFRYEWLRTRGILAAAAGLGALGVLSCAVLVMLDWTVFGALAAGIGMMLVVAFAPVMQIVLAVDYWRSSYGATGYLTQTLPVKGGRILTVKLLWAVVVTTVSLLATLVLGCILYAGFAASDERITGLGEAIRELWTASGETGVPAWLLIGALVVGYLSCLAAPVQYYFSISVGKERWLQTLGAGGPVLVFFLLGMVGQVVALVGLFAIPLGIGDGWTLGGYSFMDDITHDHSAGPNYDSAIPLGFFPPMVVLLLLCLWRTYHSWNHKVELE